MADLDDAAEPDAFDPAVQQGLDDLVVNVGGCTEGELRAQRM